MIPARASPQPGLVTVARMLQQFQFGPRIPFPSLCLGSLGRLGADSGANAGGSWRGCGGAWIPRERRRLIPAFVGFTVRRSPCADCWDLPTAITDSGTLPLNGTLIFKSQEDDKRYSFVVEFLDPNAAGGMLITSSRPTL